MLKNNKKNLKDNLKEKIYQLNRPIYILDSYKLASVCSANIKVTHSLLLFTQTAKRYLT